MGERARDAFEEKVGMLRLRTEDRFALLGARLSMTKASQKPHPVPPKNGETRMGHPAGITVGRFVEPWV